MWNFSGFNSKFPFIYQILIFCAGNKENINFFTKSIDAKGGIKDTIKMKLRKRKGLHKEESTEDIP